MYKMRYEYLEENINEFLAGKIEIDSARLDEIPDELLGIKNLCELILSDNNISKIPAWISNFNELETLVLCGNKIEDLPKEIINLKKLKDLNLRDNKLSHIPDWIKSLQHIESFDFSDNPIQELPDIFDSFTNLKEIYIQNTQIKTLPFSISKIPNLQTIYFNGSPIENDLIIAYEQGIDSLKTYIRAKSESQTAINEAKLILIGEGEVGKTCLMDALLDNPFRNTSTTHGIEIHSLKVVDSDSLKEITLNSWDFGGQKVYRPTHQLFFSAPAIYLVVWKPREGQQAGRVTEWIKLVKLRAPEAKFLIVATHGGPQQHQPDIDRQELWDTFGKETILDFFTIDSKPGKNGVRKGVNKLKQAIAKIAANLPEVGRTIPKSFIEVRQTLQDKGVPYLSRNDVIAICRDHNMDDEIAHLFISISNRLGYLTHYENDPTLRDIVILHPDWLASAMSFVLTDEETRKKHGLVDLSRLNYLWNDSARPPENRYPKDLHPIFLRLMERFDLSYRVKDPYARDESNPISLIGQLVPDLRPPNLAEVWENSLQVGDIQQIQICRIVDAHNGRSTNAEGLFYQLIVRLHKYSLGRADYKASVHWQRGLVLEDELKNRALLEHVDNDVRITVRSPYPEGLLGMLTREVKYLVESFWEGLRCDIMVPCLSPCGKTPGTGMFEVEKLMAFKKQGMDSFPCLVPGCYQKQNIDALLRNSHATTQQLSILQLQSEFSLIKDKLDEVNITSRRILSQVEKTYIDLLQVLTDEAREGPRLFSLFPIDRSNFNPKEWIRTKFRLVLWCEHSRLPLPALNVAENTKGVYDLELDREWFKRSAPYLKLLTGTLGMVLPVASSAVKLALDEAAYKMIEEQLDFGKSVIDATIGTSGKVNEFMSKPESTDLERGAAIRAAGSTLRELHALLKSKDPGFGGLIRVMNKRQEFLWVHERFAGEY